MSFGQEKQIMSEKLENLKIIFSF